MEFLQSSRDLNSAIDQFKRVAENYSVFMKKHKRSVGAWNEASMSAMAKKGEDFVFRKHDSLQRQLHYYLSAEKENVTPENEVQVLWRIMQTEKWKFPEDLFTRISNTDVIEIYDLEFTQIFANSTFMMNCSYDLSDLYAYSWPELFEREEQYTEQVIAQILDCVHSGQLKTRGFRIDTHLGREIFSKERRYLSIKMGIVAPLFDSVNRPVAFVATFKPDIRVH